MAKTGYEQTTIDEIRRILRDDHGIDDEEFLANTKSILVQRLLELQSEDNVPEDEEVDAVFDDVEEEENTTAMQPYTEEEAADTQPAWGSELWNEYVMQQFRDDELSDGAPTCDGCRRVIENLIGPIVDSPIPNIIGPTTDNNGTCTVVVRVVIKVTNENHPMYGETISCDEVADVNKDNCDHPYHKHGSATASTRAESRALRKMLRLRNVITAEEASEVAENADSDCDWQPDEPITDSQISVLDMMCSRMSMNVMDFVNSGKRVYDDITAVNKSTGQRMIRELNKVQRKQKERPQNIGPYDQNWRTSQD